jgi:Domain of unknown function (DUF4386)
MTPTKSPKRLARTIGVFFLLTVLTGIFAQGFVLERLVDSGDAAKTAANIQANVSLFRLGYAVFMIEMACNLAMTVLLYFLYRPVSRTVALLAASFGIVGITIKTFGRVFFIVPLYVLGTSHPLAGFDTAQLHAVTLLLQRIDHQAASMGLVFFGFGSLLEGWLILKSTFLPRILGVISIVAGLGWLTFLYAPLASQAFPIVVSIGLLGSVLMIFWLLVFGVNESRWWEQESAQLG